MTLRKAMFVASAALLASATALFQVSGAFAATQNLTLGFSGTSSPISIVPSTTISCCDGTDIASVTFDVHAVVNWVTAPDPVAVNYTPSNLRQGSNPDISLTNTPSSGSMNVTYSIDISGELIGISLGSTTVTETQTMPCTIPLTFDPTGSCSGTTDIQLVSVGDCSFPIGTCAELDIPITTTVSVGSKPVTSVRHANIAGGQAIPDANLTFNGPSGATINDPIDNTSISCLQPAGGDFTYSLNSNSYATNVSVGVSASLHASAEIAFITVFDSSLFTLAVGPFGPAALNMTAGNQTLDLGQILPDVTAPTLSASVVTAAPSEGSPVTFAAAASDPCGAPIVTWNFSDGGVAYGLNPQHTFEDAATYSVLVTAQNVLGLKTQLTMSVAVAEAPPTVSAGPAMSSEWGLPVNFHANGSAPGAEDNANLVYTWNFNDPALPIGAAGQDVTHTFNVPGVYAVVVTVADDNPAETGTSTVMVTVVRRGTMLTNTTASSNEVTDPLNLQASLIDDHGAPVANRQVKFFLDGGATPIATATTDSAGVAQATYVFAAGQGNVGSHTITAAFAGDASYAPSSSSTSQLTVNKDATALTYTGPTSSKPSKSLTLSAALKDDSGDPVAGKTVSFTLGDLNDSCSGTTDATGVATCTISKLDQKPGSYQVDVEFAGDADYGASKSLTAFTIGNS